MIKIETALLEHLDDILKIENLCFSPPWTEGQLLSEMESEYGIVFAAVDEEVLCAFSVMHLAGDQAELYQIATLPEKRGKGIANMLMEKGNVWAKEQNAESIFLEVRVSNAPAIALYEKHGFENLGIRKKYYTDPVEDAMIMVRKVTEDDNSCS